MEYMQMKYYPKEIYYENRGGVNYIILDYGDNKVEHVIAAQPRVQWTLLESGEKVSTCPTCAHIQNRGLPETQSH